MLNNRLWKYSLLMGITLLTIVSATAQVDTCRLDISKLTAAANPDTSRILEYEWDASTRMEVGMLDTTRFFVITQDGCKRHRTRIQLYYVQKNLKDSTELWIEEVEQLVESLFLNAEDYQKIWLTFMEEFRLMFPSFGTNKTFDISMGALDFVCHIIYYPNQEPIIQIERIEFLFKEKIRNSSP